MPQKRNDRRPPRRDAYRDVRARARQSRERALAGGATPAELAVLGAVHFWTVTFSKVGDFVSLGRIAQAAGMWEGEADNCPRYVEKRVAQRLRHLEELGAVRYWPGGQHGRGDASRVDLPKVDEGDFLTRRAEEGASIAARKGGALSAPLPDAERGSTPRSEGEQSVRERGSKTCTEGGALSAPHTRSLRGGSEETAEEPAPARVDASDVGSLAARLSACTTTDSPGQDREAHRVAELLLEHLEADVAEEALDVLADAGPLLRPGAILGALEYAIDEDHVDALDEPRDDHRFRALASGGTAYAIADACPGPWEDHLEEAELVERHLEQHGTPAGILDELLETVARDRLKRPGHAERIARRIAAELDLELPRLELPPARKITRRPE